MNVGHFVHFRAEGKGVNGYVGESFLAIHGEFCDEVRGVGDRTNV